MVGAAFDSDFVLKERMVCKIEDLKPLEESKYVQSNPEYIYREVKRAIGDGNRVLFCSTPCQVAAIKSVIGDDRNLYTADLICHGVPSLYYLDRYLKEEVKRPITKISFRDKDYGWSTDMTITFDNGEKKNESSKTNTFYRLFLSNLNLRNCCYHCKFNCLPRQGDITIGDHWGIPKEINDGGGRSVVLVNSLKGQELVSMLSDDNFIAFNLTEIISHNQNIVRSTSIPKDYKRFQLLKDYNSLRDSISLCRPLQGKSGTRLELIRALCMIHSYDA